DTPIGDVPHNGGDHPFGIGAITHIVAEKKMLLRTIFPRLSQADFEGLAIGVHVGKERNPHRKAPFNYDRPEGSAALTFIKDDRCRLPPQQRAEQQSALPSALALFCFRLLA